MTVALSPRLHVVQQRALSGPGRTSCKGDG